MRIGFLVWEYPPHTVGGLGTYSQNLCPELVKLGHDVSVFTINDGNSKTREIVQGVEVHRILTADFNDTFSLFVGEELKHWGPGMKFFNDVLSYNIGSAIKFLELIKNEGYEFDIVAAHDWLSAIAGIAIKRSANLPLVFHLHSTEWGRTGGGSPTVASIEELAGKIADRVITVSNSMKEDLIWHGFERNKIDVVYNGVDIQKYNPEKVSKEEIQKLRKKYGISEEEKMLLFVGRLVPVKGVLNLIWAMKEVKDHKVKLVILGKGELEETVRKLINELNLGENIKTQFEFISEAEKILHYGACDGAIFPSVYEPFGIVALEAMAMGKPVIVGARGISGLREIVIPGETGLHINGNDPSDIAWGINVLFSDMKKAKKMGEMGRKRVREQFSWERVAEKTIKVYEEALKK